jgi:mono/diheme cytochrome c family protein
MRSNGLLIISSSSLLPRNRGTAPGGASHHPGAARPGAPKRHIVRAENATGKGYLCNGPLAMRRRAGFIGHIFPTCGVFARMTRYVSGCDAEVAMRIASIISCATCVALSTAALALPRLVPPTWDEDALQEWATPLVGLNARPGHCSRAEYDRAPIDNLRTYPVYYPGREPAGYWEMLQAVGPKPLIEPGALHTEADWTRAGKRVFEEYDVPSFRVRDPQAIAAVRRADSFARSPVTARADGTLPDLRWIPTADGLTLGLANCASCHTRVMNDGTLVHGAPPNENPSPLGPFRIAPWAVSPLDLTGDSPGMMFWRSFAVPWIADDIHEQFKTIAPADLGPLVRPAFAVGLFPRWNGSNFYATKIPDLIGIKDRKYIDHTATHQHRSPADLMRYAALVTYADASDFGPYRMLTDAQRRVPHRASDEALYALAMYIYSLQPPANPNASDPRIAMGEQIFRREGCANCHTPPLYTNNKVTLAEGFRPPAEHARILDIAHLSVGTDPGLALRTRKGTGYYKVPSLKGVWYRGRYLHDGSFTSLEEMFNPARLQDDFVPTGFVPPGQKTRAVKGHEFGLWLDSTEKAALLAFLRSL